MKHLLFGLACTAAAVVVFDIDWRRSKTYLCAAFLVGYVLVRTVDRVASSIYRSRQEARLGCQPPYVRPHRLPGAVDRLYQAIQADKAHEVPELFVRNFAETGHHTFLQSIMGSPAYLTDDPKNIQAILALQFDEFDLGDARRGNFFPLLGNGIFTADGKMWEHSRAMLRPQFTRDQVGDLDLEEAHVQHLLRHVRPDPSGWTAEMDLSPLFFRLTLDSATEFLFGKSVSSQLAALPDDDVAKRTLQHGELDWTQMAACFDTATHDLGTRGRLGDLYWLYSPKVFHDRCKEVHKFANYYVDLALQSDQSVPASTLEKGQKPKYVFLNELAKVTRDRDELRSQLLNILLAGRDTTAGLLGWTFWLLARHPAIFEKLRKTVLDDFGTFAHPRNITFSTLKSCTYLQHTMNEVLRLYPSVPMNSRRANRDTTIPRGGGPDEQAPLFVHKGMEVGYCVHSMHRRTDLWGPDALEFRPERWMNRKGGNWDYLPFNGGPRICLGQQFALTEAGYCIVRLMQKFDQIEYTDARDEIKHQYSVTTAPLRVKVRLHEA